jgi:hypothetical protein
VSAEPLAFVPVECITRAILVLRGHKVLLHSEPATLYGVVTKRLNEQVRRNRERFPEDFMFQLTAEELDSLRPQTATSKAAPQGPDGRRYLSDAFTEHGEKDTAPVKRGSVPKFLQQMERIQCVPKGHQRFVMQRIDTVLAQRDR